MAVLEIFDAQFSDLDQEDINDILVAVLDIPQSSNLGFNTEKIILSSDKKWITFKTSDDKEFVVEESVGMVSNTVKKFVEDGCDPFVIPLENIIDGKTMGKIIEYCKRHVEESDEANLEEFDAQFLDLDQADLYDILVAVNFLDNRKFIGKGYHKSCWYDERKVPRRDPVQFQHKK